MPPRSYYIEPRASDYLALAEAFFPERLEDAQNFTNQHGRPYINDTVHLAAYLGISPALIRQILHKKEYHYREFPLEKANGETRLISTPKTYLKVIQWWIADNILNTAHLNDCVHGFVRGRSYISNAKEHFGKQHILNLDIQQFFPSITTRMISDLFANLGYSREASTLLSELCTLHGSTPTGAPTSPALGNLVLAEFDDIVCELAVQNNATYTRYADDLTFSSDAWIQDELLEQVKEQVDRLGFSLNAEKTHFMGKGDRMEVTGIIINSRPNLRREWRNWARGYLHRASSNPARYAVEWQRISGIYGTLKSVDPSEEMPLTQKAKATLVMLRRRVSEA